MADEPRTVAALRTRQRLLWVLAVCFYGVGDGVTTVAGLRATHAAEAGPVALHVLSIGTVPGIALLKVGLLGVAFVAWAAVESAGRVAIPLSLAVVGVAVTCWNLLVLAA
ncbi:MAG: hypothetical protein ABEJ70_08200 [Halobacteriaceae archaeon]